MSPIISSLATTTISHVRLRMFIQKSDGLIEWCDVFAVSDYR